MTWVSNNLLAVIMGISIAACSSRHAVEQSVAINEDAHSGGSVVVFSPAGDLLASGGWEGRIQLWRTPDGSSVQRWQAHSDSVNGIVFVDTGRQLVTAGYDGRIARWSINGRLLAQIDAPAPVTHMTAHEATDQLLSGHADGRVRLWRLSDFSLLDEQQLHRGNVKAVAIGPRGGRYASGGSDGAVFLWSDNVPARRLADPPTDAWTLVFSPDGERLMGGSWFRLYRWDLQDASLQTLQTRHRGIISAIEFLPDGAGLASISRQTDSAVYVLDPETGEILRRFQQHALCGADITVSADGRFLATTSDDASVRIWDLAGSRDSSPAE